MTIQPREWNKCCQSVSGTPFWCNGGCPETDGQIDGGPLHVPSVPSTLDGMGRKRPSPLVSSSGHLVLLLFFFFAASRLNKNWHLRLPFFLLLLVHLSVPFSAEIHHHPLSFSVSQPPQTSVRCWPSGSCIAALTVVELGRLLELVLYCGSLLGSSGTRWMKVGLRIGQTVGLPCRLKQSGGSWRPIRFDAVRRNMPDHVPAKVNSPPEQRSRPGRSTLHRYPTCRFSIFYHAMIATTKATAATAASTTTINGAGSHTYLQEPRSSETMTASSAGTVLPQTLTCTRSVEMVQIMSNE
ncbi:hypothetical protein NEUTE2DRAFT_58323 [Neurospora tetrasperma FGSC 2509]|nr:hypothetical protein NEUTE2DRAFT_58323 [Neurospora tetrasperma FGSC 2509]